LNSECIFLNRRFFTFHIQKRPYIILKWAETRDGFIDKNRKETGDTGSTWITNHTAQMLVHKWRSEELGIIAGTDTFILDDPELNVREWPGNNPVRIIPDKNGRLPEDLKAVDQSSPSLIFSTNKTRYGLNPGFVYIPYENFNIPEILKELYNRQIMSVFVEGGAKLIQSFINSGLWDEALVFSGNKTFWSGVKAPVMISEPDEKIDFRGSALYTYRNKNKMENR